MLTSVRNSLRNVGVLAVVLCIMIGGTWAAIRITTDHLLYQNATTTARSWAQFLANNVADLEHIAAGEQPSAASMAFFQGAARPGQVFRYEIFNRDGFSQLVVERGRIAFVDLSDLNADAARSGTSGQPIVDAKEGEFSDRPTYIAHAYIPIMADGRLAAIVAAYVDQTEQRNSFHKAFSIVAISLCLLSALSFGVPVIAWWRRTREKEQADQRIRFLAYHDALTGLANRAQFIERLDQALGAMSSRHAGLAVHFLDLDHFKDINDTLGHDGGDILLKTVAERLLAAVSSVDVVGRLGGDEFVVLQCGVNDKKHAETFGLQLISALRNPIKYKEHEIVATVSVGVALAPVDGSLSERLLKSADLALYRSKADGRNCIRFFSPDMDAELQSRLEMERIIRDAVARDSFELHYQPLFEVAGRRLTGFEALIRLPGPDGKLIPPMSFIPVAEEMRLIDKIGTWVLREACRTAATWPNHLTVAVNLSPTQFEMGSVSSIVAGVLQETGLEPRRLELEITESLLLGDSESVLEELRKLKAMGVSIAMDDFGTGYSSLSYLWRFPFDKIKIDRSFMQGSDSSNQDAQTVVKTIIALGRELHMRITVEGVETSQQAEFLRDVDGDQAQGYFFGRPMPASKIPATLLADATREIRQRHESMQAA
jgi:diguanylate cyclase (GGDEF)-like protein